MMTNADLTIYNSHGVDKKTARKIYLKTQIKGVNFYTKQQTTVTDQGLSSADLYQIRIPLSADTEGENISMQTSIGNYLQKKQKSIGRSTTGICLEKDC